MEFLYYELCAAILPPHSLAEILGEWEEIVEQLTEPARKRPRFVFS